MSEGVALIEKKMRSAGISEVAIKAFLFQYRKLLGNDTGLIPEEAIEPIADLPQLEERESSESAGNYLRQTLVLKLNGGLGTSMGLEKAKSLLRVRGEILLALSLPDLAAAEDSMLRSIDCARAQSALSWELRAAIPLTRMWGAALLSAPRSSPVA